LSVTKKAVYLILRDKKYLIYTSQQNSDGAMLYKSKY